MQCWVQDPVQGERFLSNPTVTDLKHALVQVGYLADDGLAMALFLAQQLGQPLLLEGEPGVGKTMAAKALAQSMATELIRLQCYDGITPSEALYEWNYQRQLLAIRLAESKPGREDPRGLKQKDLFVEEFLVERPLLRALRHPGSTAAVLLIDEIDRADSEFEALLFEFLGEGTVTIPELGTVTGVNQPVVILTSNRSRELHDALKRRCYYHWIEFPGQVRAMEIIRLNVPEARDDLVQAAAAFVRGARALDLDKPPGMAEAIDWVSALSLLGVSRLERTIVGRTLGSILKTPDDLATAQNAIEDGSLPVSLP